MGRRRSRVVTVGVAKRRMGQRSRVVTVGVARRRMGQRSRVVTVVVAMRRMGRRRSRVVTAEGRRIRSLVGGCYGDIQTF
jgi:hypothetical protein